MRSESAMMALILGVAEADERVRAVVLNGSRVDPSAPRDAFQDYDIVYLVTDVAPFRDDHSWVDRFGERIIMQMPETMSDPPPAGDGHFGYLMLFSDGNRIDLTLWPAGRAAEMGRDSLSALLLDKDGIVEPFPPPSDADYRPRPPDAKAFDDCCNEFWWVSTYVAKGLWRGELTYPRHEMEFVRGQMLKMLDWYVGVGTGFARGGGKHGKRLRRELPPELYALLERTYPGPREEDGWDALEAMGELFRRASLRVAEACGHAYPRQYDERVTAHIRHVRALPRDSKEIY